MWNYEKRLQYPVNITTPNPRIAKVIMSQYGGPDGEMGASMRYLSQRYSQKNNRVAGLLTDIGISVSKLHILKHTKYEAHHKKGECSNRERSPCYCIFNNSFSSSTNSIISLGVQFKIAHNLSSVSTVIPLLCFKLLIVLGLILYLLIKVYVVTFSFFIVYPL